jgi:glycosyltransferase involved in cell wall biosynthesis
MSIVKSKFDIIFETSWEVCNKIGGIYTVLSTKANTLQNLYKDKAIFVGPDVWSDENPSPFFTESKTKFKSWLEQTTFPNGVKVRVGRWNVPGKPLAMLVKFDGMYAVKDDLYGKMWQLYGVDSLHAYGDYDEACAFSHAAALVIESFIRYNKLDTADSNVIAHFDEWTTGMGLLHVKDALPNVATVFTTHATSIGRSICGNGKPLYDYMKGYFGDQMAHELNMESKHSLEKAAVHNADCFTTVSEITAAECEQLLDKRPDVVTPNGFEADFVPAADKYTAKRKKARKKLIDVASALTGNKYDDNTFIVGTSGRCEYRNKGIDVFLDSMNQLSQTQSQRKTLAFVMVPAWVNAAREDLKENLKNHKTLRLNTPIITHTLFNDDSDPIINRIRSLGFQNDESSNTTVIYVPCYISKNDGIFNVDYYDLLIGFDATVFPSYYEPWGYTPLESIAFGIPTVTTSLSGFGSWINSSFKNSFSVCGVNVIDRNDSNYCDVCDNIVKSLVELRNNAKADAFVAPSMKTANKAAWSNFIKFYDKAYAIASKKANKRTKIN